MLSHLAGRPGTGLVAVSIPGPVHWYTPESRQLCRFHLPRARLGLWVSPATYQPHRHPSLSPQAAMSPFVRGPSQGRFLAPESPPQRSRVPSRVSGRTGTRRASRRVSRPPVAEGAIPCEGTRARSQTRAPGDTRHALTPSRGSPTGRRRGGKCWYSLRSSPGFWARPRAPPGAIPGEPRDSPRGNAGMMPGMSCLLST